MNSRKMMVEVAGQGSALGKSLVADLARLTLKQHMPTQLVRVESTRAGVLTQGTDRHIASEGFASKAITPGGSVGVLEAVFSAIWELERGALVVDWGAGLDMYRREAFASSALDQVAKQRNIDLVSMIVTTNNLDRMVDAQKILSMNAKIIPSARSILVLNEHAGPFTCLPGTQQAKAFASLTDAIDRRDTLLIPRVDAEALRVFVPTGLDLSMIIVTDPTELARLANLNPFIALACQSHIGELVAKAEPRLCDLFQIAEAGHARTDLSAAIAK